MLMDHKVATSPQLFPTDVGAETLAIQPCLPPSLPQRPKSCSSNGSLTSVVPIAPSGSKNKPGMKHLRRNERLLMLELRWLHLGMGHTKLCYELPSPQGPSFPIQTF